MLLINADFSRRAIVEPDRHTWTTSPQAGVERVMLDRVGGEVARATSLVRYAAGSHFPRHVHGGGEEILVLAGSFTAEARDYPAGWYLRSPPGSSHQPSSGPGALLFVKLCQMSPCERDEVRIDTREPSRWAHRDGRESCPLFASDHEQVGLERLRPGQALRLGRVQGAELLVVDGQLVLDGTPCPTHAWIRVPVGEDPEVSAGSSGATLYVKSGHLSAATMPALPA